MEATEFVARAEALETNPDDGPRIRVAYVVHSFEVGGLERCVARLVNHLDRSHFEPLVICLDRSGEAAGWIKVDDARIVELHKAPGNSLRVIDKLASVLRTHRIDVVHSHNWGTLLETSVARRRACIPFHVHAEHGTVAGACRPGSWRYHVRVRAMRWALRRVEAVVVVSDSVRRRVLESVGFEPAGLHLIPNGVDEQLLERRGAELQHVRSTLGIQQDDFVVGSVGRLASVKDYGTAIRAIARLSDRGRNVHLILVGDGPERKSLTGLAESVGLGTRVHFVGQQLDVGPWLGVMDAYANSSLSEGMSLAILEAMAAGLPLVVTEVGENPSLAGGVEPCGFVVPPSNPSAMAAALDQLIGDATRRRSMRTNAAHRYANLYSTQHMVRQYENLYLEILRQPFARRHAGAPLPERLS